MFSLEHVNAVRAAEIETIIPFFRPGARILEIGAGTGQQARMLSQRGFSVTAIEMADSTYKASRVFPISEYDGRNIPCGTATFDIVFSSNVLEHVPDLHIINAEIRRVLKPDGYCIHLMPTHSWRIWTIFSTFPDAILAAVPPMSGLMPRSLSSSGMKQARSHWAEFAKHLAMPFHQRRHGERGNVISEIWTFWPNWWRRAFARDGFEVIQDIPMGLFYTGNMVFGTKLSIKRRAKLGTFFGSSCHLYHVRPTR